MFRIDRYILRETAVPALLGLLLYLSVLLVNSFFKLAELAVQHGVSLSIIGRLILYLLPNLLTMTIPMAVLLGVLVGLSTLSSRSEMVALKASGISSRRLMVPVLALGLLGALASAWVYHRLVPDWNQAYLDLRVEIARSADFSTTIKPRIFHEGIPGIVLYADDVSAEGDVLHRVLLHREPRLPDREARELYLASRARLQRLPGGELRFELFDGTQHRVTRPENYETLSFRRYVLVLDTEEPTRVTAGQRKSSRGPRQMSLAQLLEALDREFPKRGEEQVWSRRQRTYEAEIHKRFALPLAALVFSLLAFPLGSTIQRGGRASGFAISIGVILAYWVMIKWGEDQGIQGGLPPWFGVWFPNLFFLAVALLLVVLGGENSPLSRLQPLARLREALAPLGRLLAAPVRRLRDARPLALLRGGTVRGFGLSHLDRYVLTTYLRSLLFLFGSLYLVYIIGDYFLGKAKHVSQNDIAFSVVLEYYRFKTPEVIQYILPLSAMVAALVAFGMLSSSSEVRAMMCSGVSVYRVVLPVLCVALALSVFSYWIHDYVLPFANRRAEALDDKIEGRSPRSHYRPDRRWVFGDEGRLYHYMRLDEERGMFLRLEVIDLDPAFRLERRTFAARALWEDGGWVLLGKGWTRRFGGDGEFALFDKRRFGWPEPPEYFSAERKPPEEMSFGEYARYIEELSHSGYETRGMRAELWHKAAFPAVTFVLVALGLPFAFRAGRRGSLYGVGLALGLGMVYYAVMAVFTALGRAELLPPLLAAFAPNILFLGTGLYLLLTVRT